MTTRFRTTLAVGATALLLAGCAGMENAGSGAQHTTTVYVEPSSSSSDPQGDPGAVDGQAGPGAEQGQAGPAAAPPVEGAYAGAGGPRPAGAEPLPTYSQYGVTNAHLLSPTGGIGCSFRSGGDAGQGGCGVESYYQSKLYGCHQMGATCQANTWFGFSDGRVQPISARNDAPGYKSGNHPTDYTVPRIEYGKVVYFENWTCASEMHGMTCWNTETGSGVFLSNERSEQF